MVESGRVTVSNSSHVCVQGIAEFNWYDSGFSDHSAWAYTFAQTPGCGPELVVPVGWIATKLWLFRWTGSAWASCQESSWGSGGGGDIHDGDITYEQSATVAMFWQGAPPPCGGGWYGTLGRHLVWTGSAWEGDNLWSGDLNVPATGLAADSADEPPPPPWVQEDNTVRVDNDAAIIYVPVVGRGGQVVVKADGSPRMVPIWIGEVPPTPAGG